MQKYGLIKDGQLELSSKQREGYKPVKYADIPEFDQSTHYVMQTAPVEETDHIYVGIEFHKLPEDLTEGDNFDGEIIL